MQINSISYSAPKTSYSNQDVVDIYKEKTNFKNESDRKKYFLLVEKMLKYSGANKRRARDIEAGETAFEHIQKAMKQSLAEASLEAQEIDLLIYCGVGKGFTEPSNAYFYAQSMGMETTQCFDVVDACMSWVRACQISQTLLKTGAYKNVMVITGEFHKGLRDTLEVNSVHDLKYNFPLYTIGEAATATILKNEGDDWDFSFSSRPSFADLCTIPIPGYETYIEPSDKIGLNGPGKFVSFGKELLEAAAPVLSQLIVETIPDLDSKSIYLPHAPAKTIYVETMTKIGIPESKLFTHVFENFGNLVSSSIPVAFVEAQRLGRLHRGDEISLIPASAGLSAACVQMKF